MSSPPSTQDSGMAQLDVFFSLFGIILVVIAVINPSINQHDELPNFSKNRSLDKETDSTRILNLGYITPARHVWYVTQETIYEFKREVVANQLMSSENSEMIILSDMELPNLGTFSTDGTDPSGYFLQLDADRMKKSIFFKPILSLSNEQSDNLQKLDQTLRNVAGKPLLIFSGKKAQKNTLLVETLAVKLGISIRKSPLKKFLLVRTPSFFYRPSRAR